MQRIPTEQTTNARRLRREAAQKERDLWRVLKAARPRFTRQLGRNALRMDEDAIRTAYLEERGWTVVRFWNGDVRDNIDGVFQVINASVAQASTHPRPLPFREGS